MADEIFILINGDGTDHLHRLEISLKKLKESRLEWNIERYFFGKPKI